MSVAIKRLLVFAVLITIAAIAGQILPGMLLNYLLTGELW